MGIGPIARGSGELITDEAEMAEELNEYFSSVFTREDISQVPDPPPMRTRTRLTRTSQEENPPIESSQRCRSGRHLPKIATTM